MKVAVSGAFGYIAKHVIAELERRSLAPILIARPGAARPPHAAQHEVVELDIKAPPGDAFERLRRPDALIHLAWGGLPQYASSHHFEQELPAHYRFLAGLLNEGLSNLLVTGTCFEYGMQFGPLREDFPTRPLNAYGHAKNSLRAQLEYLQRQKPFKLTWARLFYLYGDGQPRGALRAQLRAAVESGAATFNMSGGEQLRDFLSVEEVAKSLVALTISNRDHGIVNVCSGEPISVRRLVESWIRENGWSIALNLGHYPYPENEPLAFWGDRQKLDACIDARKLLP